MKPPCPRPTLHAHRGASCNVVTTDADVGSVGKACACVSERDRDREREGGRDGGERGEKGERGGGEIKQIWQVLTFG